MTRTTSEYEHGFWKDEVDNVSERRSLKFLSRMAKYIRKDWGERCPEVCSGCAVCQMWALYDLTAMMIPHA